MSVLKTKRSSMQTPWLDGVSNLAANHTYEPIPSRQLNLHVQHAPPRSVSNVGPYGTVAGLHVRMPCKKNWRDGLIRTRKTSLYVLAAEQKLRRIRDVII